MASPRGDDDRATVDLGPRPLIADGGDAPADGDEDDRGDDSVVAGDLPHPITRTVQLADPVHHLPTQQLPHGRQRGMTGAANDSQASRYSTTASPVAAMRLDEIQRTKVFLRVAIVTSLAAVIAAWLAGGDPDAFWTVVVGASMTAGGSAWMLNIVRDPDKYSPKSILPAAIVIAVGSFGGVYYWGVGSPVAAMYVWGIYFFSLGGNPRITTGIYALIAGLHGLFGVLVISGAVVDHGIIRISGLRTTDEVTILAIVEFLYFITFFTARVSQKVTLEAMGKLETAVRGVANREALLAEARAELDRALKIGGPGRFTDQVVGSYRLGVLIGRGGMGEVYEAHSVTDQREAAVKLLHPGTLGDPTHVARFLREAETAAKLDCPNVVRVLEVGTTTGEVPFLAMERLRGHDLAHQLRRQRRLQMIHAITLVDHVSIGLEAARAAGIVHRDLKPHNVFFAEAGEKRVWKILDFGVSKVGGSGTLTKGHVVGTPAYMAPEQAKGEDVDHRADVYSLAAILYRALTGHPAFTGKDVPSTLYDVVYRVPTQPSILAPLPADVDRVLAIGLAKDKADRFATATELAAWMNLAVVEGLSHEQRHRADELAAKQPWGTRSP